MSLTIKSTFLILVWLAWTPQVFAKVQLFVEPYLGYGQFSFKIDQSDDQNLGAVLGGKGGLLLGDDLFGGLDYHLGGPYNISLPGNFSGGGSIQYSNFEFFNRMFGLGKGFNYKETRIWLGYYWLDEIEDSNQFVVYKGVGYKLSLGFMFQNKLMVNVEYVLHDIKETQVPGYLSSTQLPEEDLISSSSVFISVSAPLKLTD